MSTLVHFRPFAPVPSVIIGCEILYPQTPMLLFKLWLLAFTASTCAEILPDSSASPADLNSDVIVTFGSSNQTVPAHCVNTRFVVRNRQDLFSILDCNILKGNLEIVDYEDPILSLPHLNFLDGSLSITHSPHLIRIEAHELSKIAGGFTMEKLTSLAVVAMPSLESVRFLEWQVLPIFGNLKFGDLQRVESVVIADTSLARIIVNSAEIMRSLDLNNNRFLDYIKSDVQHIEDRLHIGANGRNLKVDLGLLKSTRNMSIHNVGDIQIGNLEFIKGSASIIDNNFQMVNFTNLLNVEGTLSIALNKFLKNANFPAVSEIGGGLLIVNNTVLLSILFFPRLNIIGGALDLAGNIREAAWDKLKLVKGSARLVTSVPTFDCKKWVNRDVGTIIRGGKIECSIFPSLSKEEPIVAETTPVPTVSVSSSAHLLKSKAMTVMVAMLSIFGI